jgi:hypothetical protein
MNQPTQVGKGPGRRNLLARRESFTSTILRDADFAQQSLVLSEIPFGIDPEAGLLYARPVQWRLSGVSKFTNL